MQVRPVADLAEFRGAMAVNVRAWRAAYDDILPDDVLDGLAVADDEELRDRYEETVADPDVAFLVALAPESPAAEEGVVGFAEARWGEETKAFVGADAAGLRAIYVAPERWGEGVGTELLAAAVEAVPDDREALALSVFAANDGAREFYEARDFERVGSGEYEVAGERYPTAIYERPLDG